MPGVAVIRAARTAEAAKLMSRRLQLLRRLGSLGLPFRVPAPLSDAIDVDGVTVSALTWIDGAARQRGTGGTDELRRLISALKEVDTGQLVAELDVPHAYAGRERWADLLCDEVVPRLPADVREEARRRVTAALALPDVPGVLVHGDLAGSNLLWLANGTLSGIVDWDLACTFDPAVDAACLAWFGWDAVESMVEPDTLRRARIWFATFGIEQVTAALLDLRSEGEIDSAVIRAAAWIRRTK